MKSPCLNARALILSLQPCSGQNDSGMTNLSFRAGNEWAGVLLFPYRESARFDLWRSLRGLQNLESRSVLTALVEFDKLDIMTTLILSHVALSRSAVLLERDNFTPGVRPNRTV